MLERKPEGEEPNPAIRTFSNDQFWLDIDGRPYPGANNIIFSFERKRAWSKFRSERPFERPDIGLAVTIPRGEILDSLKLLLLPEFEEKGHIEINFLPDDRFELEVFSQGEQKDAFRYQGSFPEAARLRCLLRESQKPFIVHLRSVDEVEAYRTSLELKKRVAGAAWQDSEISTYQMRIIEGLVNGAIFILSNYIAGTLRTEGEIKREIEIRRATIDEKKKSSMTEIDPQPILRVLRGSLETLYWLLGAHSETEMSITFWSRGRYPYS